MSVSMYLNGNLAEQRQAEFKVEANREHVARSAGVGSLLGLHGVLHAVSSVVRASTAVASVTGSCGMKMRPHLLRLGLSEG